MRGSRVRVPAGSFKACLHVICDNMRRKLFTFGAAISFVTAIVAIYCTMGDNQLGGVTRQFGATRYFLSEYGGYVRFETWHDPNSDVAALTYWSKSDIAAYGTIPTYDPHQLLAHFALIRGLPVQAGIHR